MPIGLNLKNKEIKMYRLKLHDTCNEIFNAYTENKTVYIKYKFLRIKLKLFKEGKKKEKKMKIIIVLSVDDLYVEYFF